MLMCCNCSKKQIASQVNGDLMYVLCPPDGNTDPAAGGTGIRSGPGWPRPADCHTGHTGHRHAPAECCQPTTGTAAPPFEEPISRVSTEPLNSWKWLKSRLFFPKPWKCLNLANRPWHTVQIDVSIYISLRLFRRLWSVTKAFIIIIFNICVAHCLLRDVCCFDLVCSEETSVISCKILV